MCCLVNSYVTITPRQHKQIWNSGFWGAFEEFSNVSCVFIYEVIASVRGYEGRERDVHLF
jgi:hypothetical protein